MTEFPTNRRQAKNGLSFILLRLGRLGYSFVCLCHPSFLPSLFCVWWSAKTQVNSFYTYARLRSWETNSTFFFFLLESFRSCREQWKGSQGVPACVLWTGRSIAVCVFWVGFTPFFFFSFFLSFKYNFPYYLPPPSRLFEFIKNKKKTRLSAMTLMEHIGFSFFLSLSLLLLREGCTYKTYYTHGKSRGGGRFSVVWTTLCVLSPFVDSFSTITFLSLPPTFSIFLVIPAVVTFDGSERNRPSIHR